MEKKLLRQAVIIGMIMVVVVIFVTIATPIYLSHQKNKLGVVGRLATVEEIKTERFKTVGYCRVDSVFKFAKLTEGFQQKKYTGLNWFLQWGTDCQGGMAVSTKYQKTIFLPEEQDFTIPFRMRNGVREDITLRLQKGQLFVAIKKK